jgi:hypothetical protein
VRLGEWDINTEIDCVEDGEDDEDDIDTPKTKFCAPAPIDNQVVEPIHYKDYRQAAPNQHFDIALLRLAKKVQSTKFVQPICLPLDSSMWDKDFTDHTFEVAGKK